MAPRRLLAAAFAALVLSAPAMSGQQLPDVFTPGGTLPVLESYLESLRQQAGIPGLSAAVVRDGTIAWERGFGYQNVAARARAMPDTPYLVGDASGTLAATLLLQCVEQGHIGLDDALSRFGLSSPEPTATLRGLLSHESPPAAGGSFDYSPERYAHLTALMEWCAPQPYRKSVAHRILNRLHMDDSVPGVDLMDHGLELPEGLFNPDDIDRYHRVLDRLAVPYRVEGRGRVVEQTGVPSQTIDAAAGLVSTVRDLAKLDRALDDFELLQSPTIATAWNAATDPFGDALPTGLGWFVQSYRGERLVWHFGYVPNAYSALILKLPDRRLTLILLANSDGLSAPYQLSQGDVTRSAFASLFLKLVL